MLQLDAAKTIRNAAEQSEKHMADVRRLATQQVGKARTEVPALLSEIRAEARQTLQTARAAVNADKALVIDRAAADLRYVKAAATTAFDGIAVQSRGVIALARSETQALMREIAGQGPDKTLSRGFALVRDTTGVPVTSADDPGGQVTIQFRDGVRTAQLQKDKQ